MNRTQADRDQIQLALCGLQAILAPKDVLTLETQRGYLQALSALTVDQIETACGIAARTLRWFPKPSELLELIQGNPNQRAERAWEMVCHAIDRYGAYESVQFTDPAISRAINRIGGWVSVCYRTEKWVRKEFLESYKLVDAPGTAPARLKGLHERKNGPRVPKRIECDWSPHGPNLGFESEVRKIAGSVVESVQISK